MVVGGRGRGRARCRVAVLALTAGSCSFPGPAAGPTTTTTVAPTAPVTAAPRAGYPTPSAAPSAAPLRNPTARVTAGARFAFLATQQGSVTPVTYDPCRPIAVVVNRRTAPDGAADLVGEAIAAISAAAGFEMRLEGPTSEAPASGRPSFQADRYGDRWAPVLVAWSDPDESPHLAGEVAGSGGSTPLQVSPGGPTVFVTGMVVLDGPQIAGMLAAPGGRETARAVVLHELGHLLGLGHVDDPSELMHGAPLEGTPTATGLGPGDLSGLATLRSGATCVGQL